MKSLRSWAAWTAAVAVAAFWTRMTLQFLPRARGCFDATVADIGEGLLHASHATSVHVPYRMPFDPLLEALGLAHAGPTALAAGTWLFSATAAGLAFALGAELAGTAGGLSVCALWGGILWDLPMGSGFYKQFWLTLLIMGSAIALARHARRRTVGAGAEAGLWIGLSLYARSSLFLLPPLLATRELFSAPKEGRPGRACALLFLPLALLLPWVAMNAVILRKFVPLEHGPANMNIVTGALGMVKTAHGDYRSLMDGASTKDACDAPLGWAARRVLAHPLAYARGVARRVAYVAALRPWLLLLALAGLLLRRDDPALRAVAGLAAYFVAVNCMMSIEADHFEPVWPLLAALASGILPWPRELSAPAALGARISRLAALTLFSLLVVFSWRLCLRYARTSAPDSGAALDAALARAPHDTWLRMGRARLLSAAGRNAEALSDVETAWARARDLPRLRLLRAWILAKSGRPALLLAGSYTNYPLPDAFSDSQREAAPLLQALALERLGRRSEATKRFEAALSSWREAKSFIDPDFEEELALPQKLLRDDSDDSFINRIAQILKDDSPSDRELALVLLLRVRPQLRRAQSSLREMQGARLSAARDVAGARLFERWTRSPEERIQAVRLWEELGRFEESARLLRAEIRDRPLDASLRKDLGVALFRGGHVEESIAALREAVRLNPTEPHAADSLAAARAAPRRAQPMTLHNSAPR